MPFLGNDFKTHICVLHQTTFSGECDECASTRGVLEALKLKALERVALKEIRRLDEEERLETERLEAERIEKQRLETEEAAKSLISIRRVVEVEENFPIIVSLLKAPSKLNGRRQ